MKNIIFCLFAFLVTNGFAQSTVLLTKISTSETIAANTTISATTAINSTTGFIFDVKNVGNTINNYKVKRYDVALNSTASETASAHFCFAGSCYGSNTTISSSLLTLSPGQSASQSTISFNSLTVEFDETSTTVGYSHIKYTIFNVSNLSDSTQISIKYNAPAGLNDKHLSAAKMDIFPNPAKDNFTVKLNFNKNEKSNVVVFNSIGREVFSTEVNLIEGVNFVPLNINNLSGGVYFLKISTYDGSVTKKLIIE